MTVAWFFCSIRHLRNYLFRADYLGRVSSQNTYLGTYSIFHIYFYLLWSRGPEIRHVLSTYLCMAFITKSYCRKKSPKNTKFVTDSRWKGMQWIFSGGIKVTVRAQKPSRKGDYRPETEMKPLRRWPVVRNKHHDGRGICTYTRVYTVRIHLSHYR